MEHRLDLAATVRAPERAALACDDGIFTYSELTREQRRLAGQLHAMGARQVLLHAQPTFTSYAALAALAELALPVVLLAANPSPAVLEAVYESIGADAVVRDGNVVPHGPGLGSREPLPSGSVVIVTSGTTGPPKLVCHSWATLSRAVRVRPELGGSVWLVAYPYHLYAGLQVVLHVLLNAGTAVLLPQDGDVRTTLARMAEHAVAFVSGTPSFFRRLLLFSSREVLGKLRLEQITLGGERVTQDVLNALHSAFPAARIVHIYASSELGRCFSVEDGREGFPAEMLATGTKDGVRLRIRDGELEVQPVNAMNGYVHAPSSAPHADGWIPTGDLVDRVGDRVLFRGRRHDLINVGGAKVNPATVEDVIRGCAGVRDARVFARRSALVGELVAVDVVAQAGEDEARLREALAAHCAERLSAAERPRIVRFVPLIALSEAGKTIRNSEG
jgi:acyl-CoA synthetase (AMP-forming)/AMP-acid ligase II